MYDHYLQVTQYFDSVPGELAGFVDLRGHSAGYEFPTWRDAVGERRRRRQPDMVAGS